jgi:cytosolic carboxypeptidase protein 1
MCFFAYHYPFTYSDLQKSLHRLQSNPNYNNICRRTTLCRTLGGNDCILLTITNFHVDEHSIPLTNRRYVFMTARVHPGESNSSHIMTGLIQFLQSTDPVAVQLRNKCVFKIIPMLNPDGVVNGHGRCSLAGDDLNRQWTVPSRVYSPTIFWAKLMVRTMTKLGRTPFLACDIHGHSRKKNIFLIGCENVTTTTNTNNSNVDDTTIHIEKRFETLLSTHSQLFTTTPTSKHPPQKGKKSTCRFVLCQEFHIGACVTVEATYCGFDVGDVKVW